MIPFYHVDPENPANRHFFRLFQWSAMDETTVPKQYSSSGSILGLSWKGSVRLKKRLPLSLTFDHRIIDEAPAARFLQTLVHLLAEPDGLL